MSEKMIVNVTGGMIEGYTDEDGVNTFKGIPYAAPPVGDLRFCPPQPVIPWDGILECKEYGPIAVQSEAGGWNRIPDFIKEKLLASELMRQLAEEREKITAAGIAAWTDEYVDMGRSFENGQISEDCLSLNIWTTAKENEKLPVFFYIHGGANTSGSGAVEVYCGKELAKQGVVVVTINYRLGMFGFLAMKDKNGEETYGNMAIKDQIAALKWVQENIEKFGGDPSRVTIGGQSAGSGNCQTLLISPAAKGLFHQVICMSGNSYSKGKRAFKNKTLKELQEETSKKLAQYTLDDLRKMSAKEILNLSNQGGFPMTCIDNEILTGDIVEAYATGKFNHVNMMFGSVTEDCTLFSSLKPLPGEDPMMPCVEMSADTLKKKIQISMTKHMAEECEKVYAVPENKANVIDVAKTLMSDSMNYSYYDAMKAKESHDDENKNYIYHFTRVIPDTEIAMKVNGAFHSGDMGYWFNIFSNTYPRNWSEDDYKLGHRMSSYLTNFVKTGNPNGMDVDGELLPLWKSANECDRPGYMHLDIDAGWVDMDEDKAEFWKKYSAKA